MPDITKVRMSKIIIIISSISWSSIPSPPCSCNAKSFACGCFRERLGRIGHSFLKCRAVKPGASHGLVCPLPVRAADGVHALRVHVPLDFIDQRVKLCRKFFLQTLVLISFMVLPPAVWCFVLCAFIIALLTVYVY